MTTTEENKTASRLVKRRVPRYRLLNRNDKKDMVIDDDFDHTLGRRFVHAAPLYVSSLNHSAASMNAKPCGINVHD